MKKYFIKKAVASCRVDLDKKRVRMLFVSFCLIICCVTIKAQNKVKDILWQERFTNGIDASVFPDLVTKYQAVPLSKGGVSLTFPKESYASYDSKYLTSNTGEFRSPIRVIKNYSGSVLYDSIRLEMAGVYFIDSEDYGWEKDFTFSFLRIDNQLNQTNFEYFGKLTNMTNSRGGDVTKVCVNCSSVNFNVESFAYANFYKSVYFEKIVSIYKNQFGAQISPSKTASSFPMNQTEFTLPKQSDLDFSQSTTSNLLREYFCEQCSKDIDGTNMDFEVYINCVNSTQLISTFDYFIKFNFPGYNLVGYRNSIPTSIVEEVLNQPKEVVQAFNLFGQTITDIDNYSGFIILVFSDGTKQKVFNNIK